MIKKILVTIIFIVLLGAISVSAPLWFTTIVGIISLIGVIVMYALIDSNDIKRRGRKRGEEY